MQDIVTSILFATFLLLVAVTGVMIVVFLPQSGIVPSDMALTSVHTDNLDAPSASMPVSMIVRWFTNRHHWAGSMQSTLPNQNRMPWLRCTMRYIPAQALPRLLAVTFVNTAAPLSRARARCV